MGWKQDKLYQEYLESGYKEWESVAWKKLKGTPFLVQKSYNGSEDSNEDCKGYSCPLYPFHPHNENRLKLHKKPTFSFSKQPKDSQTDMSTSKQERKP